jgi:hypothetical protein
VSLNVATIACLTFAPIVLLAKLERQCCSRIRGRHTSYVSHVLVLVEAGARISLRRRLCAAKDRVLAFAACLPARSAAAATAAPLLWRPGASPSASTGKLRCCQ